MYENVGRSLGTDYFRIAEQLTHEERSYWRRTRDFVDDEVLPVINGYWERAEFPWALVEKLGKLGIVGGGISGYGCPQMSPIANGLVHLELNRGDGSFQLVQEKLVKMLAEVCSMQLSMQLYCLRPGRLMEEGNLTDTIAALAKMNNTRKAREVIAEARDLLGMRHMADIEAIHTYEGTETIQTLIVGQDITGVSAFT